MNAEALAQIVVRNGVKQTDLSMFSLDEQKRVYARAGEELLRLNRINDAIDALERAGKLPIEMLRKMAQSKMDLREYESASVLFEKIGDKEMADFLKENFS